MSPRLPPEAPTSRMVRQLGAIDAAPREPGPGILEAVRRCLHQALVDGGDPDYRDLKRAPWILWQGEPPAINFPGLLDRVVDQATRSPRALRYLIEAWLRDFSSQISGIAPAGLAIQRLLADSTYVRLDPWRSAQDKFRLFDAADGPASLAGAVLSGPGSVATVLEAAGFSDETRVVSGYLRAVQSELLARVPAALRGPGASEQIKIKRACQFLTSGKLLRFDDCRAAVANALCQPWLDDGRPPGTDLQRVVKDFLVQRIGNPQLRAGRWAGAEEEAALIRRWLARASLQVFFGLIKDYALDEQWIYREAFWSACLQRGVIDEAWLALGAKVNASARARQGLGTAFGQLVGGGALADQSVLLLRIGPLTIAEWSHMGKLRAWTAQHGPRLGDASYTRRDLVKPCLQFPVDPLRGGRLDGDPSGLIHTGSATGLWQRRAAALLARYANVVLTSPEWRPR
jgi:hypothetical protein